MNIYVDDATGEIALENNNWKLITGVSEIAQIMKQNLQTVLGEVWLNTELGLPWFDEIFEKSQTQKNIDALIIAEISQTPGFISLARYSSSIDEVNRVLTVDFEAYTVEGILDFSTTLTPTGGQ